MSQVHTNWTNLPVLMDNLSHDRFRDMDRDTLINVFISEEGTVYCNCQVTVVLFSKNND